MTQEEIHSRRASIRKKILAIRSEIPENIRTAYSKLIEDHFFSHYSSHIASLHSYISYKSEVDTSGIIKRLLKNGTAISTPYLESVTSEQFQNVKFESFNKLVEGPYCIMQPSTSIKSDTSSLEYVLIPLAAFDGFGNRLGYGKGYYDRFLSQLPSSTTKIGLAYSSQEVDEIPSQEHDVPLDLVITEQGILKPSVRV
ncbi:MAG TPA: 5-formyltetrahydrofolate cyclo-ligase [Candidatus Kapabacteria bacterium]